MRANDAKSWIGATGQHDMFKRNAIQIVGIAKMWGLFVQKPQLSS
jgi:hypothetical protein